MSDPQRPTVLVASADERHARDLQAALPDARVRHTADAESLLRDTHAFTPDVTVIHASLPSRVPIAEVLRMLRGRDDLTHTHHLLIGGNAAALMTAGADLATPAQDASTPALVYALLRRVRQTRHLTDRAAKLQTQLTAAEHDERVRDQLTHMLVHDLKNPISAVMGLLEVVMEDEGRIPDDLAELLRLAREETQHLLHLAVNMLDVRKMQAGKMHLDRQTMFAPMFSDVVNLALGDVGAGLRDRRVNLNFPLGLSPAHGDPEILRRVFANLISNAVKHTTAGGRVDIGARQTGDTLEFTVADDGEGIPAEDLPNLFAAFEQSRLTLHGRFDTGMGLAFCKLAIEQHGGRIWVESERGVGTTFTFTLPLGPEEDDDFAELV
ncbi:sensor histidine kinase [Deinococcus maricopensis]|uniref:histidine kinase n=1 Tax=Deinococcus maricopensis (strain DSM 21211 / LMG 22137 / NRRL B-23946 / LB-34) TaxID=709986 RepID=E8U9H3_DEIML|nr:HAMP domain-containing sensor histidine kinase [Deinococcus maricopensis]ADV67712.1 histidine kinase [Deinococcus maricopensis DSM 21211]